MRRLSGVVASAAHPESPARDTWVSASLTFRDSRASAFRRRRSIVFPRNSVQGMAARARQLHDVGENAPEHWEKPLGTGDVHVVLTGISTDAATLETGVARAREAYQNDCRESRRSGGRIATLFPTETEPFGFKDGISHPAIEGSGIPGTNPHEVPLKAGEFVLGYPDEYGGVPPVPQPEVLGRNGSYVVFRKLHQRVAEFRRYLKANASNADDEEFLAAKMMGRWRSGAPLASCPVHDDPAIGADSTKNNAFLFKADDPLGYKTPLGSHIRRVNPRDADVAGVAANPSDDSARHGVRAALAGGRSRGRRRGSRADVRFRRRESRPSVRVRSVGMDER